MEIISLLFSYVGLVAFKILMHLCKLLEFYSKLSKENVNTGHQALGREGGCEVEQSKHKMQPAGVSCRL